MIHISKYKPGRFAYLMEKAFTKDLWDFLTFDEHVQRMISATESNQPAIFPLLAGIESKFGEHLASTEYPEEDVGILINNMVKQILEMQGYQHTGCGLCRHGRYIRQSGVYAKIG